MTVETHYKQHSFFVIVLYIYLQHQDQKICAQVTIAILCFNYQWQWDVPNKCTLSNSIALKNDLYICLGIPPNLAPLRKSKTCFMTKLIVLQVRPNKINGVFLVPILPNFVIIFLLPNFFMTISLNRMTRTRQLLIYNVNWMAN